MTNDSYFAARLAEGRRPALMRDSDTGEGYSGWNPDTAEAPSHAAAGAVVPSPGMAHLSHPRLRHRIATARTVRLAQEVQEPLRQEWHRWRS